MRRSSRQQGAPGGGILRGRTLEGYLAPLMIPDPSLIRLEFGGLRFQLPENTDLLQTFIADPSGNARGLGGAALPATRQSRYSEAQIPLTKGMAVPAKELGTYLAKAYGPSNEEIEREYNRLQLSPAQLDAFYANFQKAYGRPATHDDYAASARTQAENIVHAQHYLQGLLVHETHPSLLDTQTRTVTIIELPFSAERWYDARTGSRREHLFTLKFNVARFGNEFNSIYPSYTPHETGVVTKFKNGRRAAWKIMRTGYIPDSILESYKQGLIPNTALDRYVRFVFISETRADEKGPDETVLVIMHPITARQILQANFLLLPRVDENIAFTHGRHIPVSSQAPVASETPTSPSAPDAPPAQLVDSST